jgi:ABC-2 type transport system ATP-binding protein
MSEMTLEARSVVKAYGTTKALRGVDLDVEAGQILVLLGPNGAGKTTLVSIIAGLIKPDAGTILVKGIDVAKKPARARSHIGMAAQETAIYPTVSVRHNLRLFGRIGGLRGAALERRVDSLAEVLNLTEFLDRKARFMSGGEKRRLHAALALINEPALLLLDEPTTGADPSTRQNMLRYIAELAGAGTAVVYTTHYMAEINALGPAATVAILDKGTIIAAGAVSDLLDRYAARVAVVSLHSDVTSAAVDKIAGSLTKGCTVSVGGPNELRVASHQPVADALEVLTLLGRTAADVRGLDLLERDLESVFLSITGSRYEEAV